MDNNNPSLLQERILSWSPHSVIFPFYHAISDEYCPHLSNLYRVHTIGQFERDIDQLLQVMSPLSAEDSIRSFHKNSGGKPSFHLSFDDGLREAKAVIAPILLRKGIPATFFITTGFTNNSTLFHRHKVSLILETLKTFHSTEILRAIALLLNTEKSDRITLLQAVKSINFKTAPVLDEIASMLNIDFAGFLKKEQPYLNASEIKELADSGFSIGLHSLNHPEFHLLNGTEMNFQITASRLKLQELTGLDSNLFSFPFTDSGIPDQFIRKATQQFKITTFGTAGIKDDSIEGHFQRIPMDARYSKSAIQLIANEILRYRIKGLFGRQKVKR